MSDLRYLDDLLRGLVEGQAHLADRLAELERGERDPATLAELYAGFRGLAGLRGLWYPGVADDTGAMYDASGQGRTLTYNGNPTIDLHNSLVPYFDYDGTGDYHSRADEAGLDVLGTETYIATALRGLTVGGWFWTDDATSNITQGLVSKYVTTGNQRSWHFTLNTGGGIAVPSFTISADGTTAIHRSDAASALVVNTWNFIVGRLTPGTENAVFLNDAKAVNTTTVPASVFNSTAGLEVARRNVASSELNGRCALAFLCAAALPDALLSALFSQTRGVFGV